MNATLLRNCLSIIAVWEGNTLYAHGDGAVGIIGFQFGWRERLHQLMGLPAKASDDDFNGAVDLDKNKARQQQMQLGIEVLNDIYAFSCQPRGLQDFQSVLTVLDIAINNGKFNNFLGPKITVGDEQIWTTQVCQHRISAIHHLLSLIHI